MLSREKQEESLSFSAARVPLTALLLAALAAACSKEAPPQAEEPRSAAQAEGSPPANPAAPSDVAANPPAAAVPAAVTAGEPAAPTTGASKVSESNFDLSLSPKGSYKAGQPGQVEVVLEAKSPFKVNDKYPYKFKAQATDGVKYENAVVGKDALKLEAKRAVMTVGFTPEAAGTKKIAGQFSFSVCTDDKCLIEKRELALDVRVD